MRRHITWIAIIWFTLTVVAELLLPYWGFPVAAAHEAEISDEAFRLLLVLGAPVFTFVISALGYSVLVFRAKGSKLEDGTSVQPNGWVTGSWLAITGGLCLFIIVNPGLTGLASFQGSQIAQVEVRVVGHQWNWEVDYPEQGLAGVQEIVLPIDQRVHFSISSADVLHAFWIPAFRNKVDAIPGRVTNMYVTPTQLGSIETDYNFRAQCTEICGESHAKMFMPVRVVSEEEFKSWVEQQMAAMPSNPILRGQRLAQSQGCAQCHSIDGTTLIGPTWKDVFGSQVELADGSTVLADDAYLRESIIDPNAKVVKGFQPDVMPKTFGTALQPDQIDDLVTYIKSLSPAASHVEVVLTEYKLEPSIPAVKTGLITFTVVNHSSTTMHEMILIKTDLLPQQIPVDDTGALIEDNLVENQAEAINERMWKAVGAEDIEAGASKEVSAELPAGHYVMFCNKPGHYHLEMYREFWVVE